MLRQRLLFGTLMIVALVGLAWLDEFLAQRVADDWTPSLLINVGLYFHEGAVLMGLVGVVVVLATRELGGLLRAAGQAPAVGVAVVANLGLIAIPWLVRNGLTDTGSADPMTDYQYTGAWLVLALFAVFAAALARRRTEGAIGAVGSTLLMVFYVGLLASYVVRLRMRGESAWLVLYFLLVCKVCDIGAYFTGLAVGRTQLIGWLSPKKTVEGVIGGTAASVAVAYGVARLVRVAGPVGLRGSFPTGTDAAVFGLAMALLGQAGDLVESLFKREARAKDSAAVVPAFGGVLDIIDSPLVTAPVAYWLLVE